jgi:DNA-binding MarR family transcriptional regulator
MPVTGQGPGRADRRGTGKELRHAGRSGLGSALFGAWLGYRRRMDEELAALGFAGRRFPDMFVLRMCSGAGETTISQIGRGLGITRQGASKIVTGLGVRGYVTVTPSPTSGREKVVRPTSQGAAYLDAVQEAQRIVDGRLRADIGSEELGQFYRVLEHLGGGERPLPPAQLRELRVLGGLSWPGPSPGALAVRRGRGRG